MRKTTFLPFKQVKDCFKVMNFFRKIPKVSKKIKNLIPFEGFSQVFRLILRFWNMSEVVYEKKVYFSFLMEYFLHFKINFDLRSISSKFRPYCWICSGFLH